MYLLSKYPDKKVGFLTKVTSIFVSNKTMKLFMISIAPNEKRLHNMSAHSAGTVFEALLQKCDYQSIVIESYIDKINEIFNPEEIMNNLDDASLESVTETELFNKTLEERTTHYQPTPPASFNSSINSTETISMANYIHENQT